VGNGRRDGWVVLRSDAALKMRLKLICNQAEAPGILRSRDDVFVPLRNFHKHHMYRTYTNIYCFKTPSHELPTIKKINLSYPQDSLSRTLKDNEAHLRS
jgi:hypothetical protein